MEAEAQEAVSPRYKQAKKIADQAQKTKIRKEQVKVIKQYEEPVFSTMGKKKIRLVTELSNGRKYRTLKR